MDMPYEDLQRDFVNCVVMYKNKPVYIQGVSKTFEVLFTDLITQELNKAPFVLKDFAAPTRRLGFVNIGSSCVYVTRTPIRKFYMGLNNRNISVTPIDIEYRGIGMDAVMRTVKNLCCKELGTSLLNKYPSFKDAIKQVKEFGGACAFDKQFAVSAQGRIFYRSEVVGSTKLTGLAKISSITWAMGREHLILLLEKNHEKDLSAFRITAK